MSRFADFFVHRRGLFALVALLLTAIAYWGNERLEEDGGSIARNAPPSRAEETLREVNEDFADINYACYLLVDFAPSPAESDSKPQLFSAESIASIRDFVGEVEGIAGVGEVVWLDRVVSLTESGGFRPLLPAADATAEAYADARRHAREHPLVAGQLFAEDEAAFLMFVTLDVVESQRSTPQIIDDINDVAGRASADTPLRFRLTGIDPLVIEAGRIARRENDRYMMIGPVLAFVLAAWLFRGAAAVIIVSLAPIVGIYWIMGAMGIVGEKINPLNAATLPILVMMIGFTDSIHLMIHIRRSRHQGDSPKSAARSAIARVGLACILTSVTTAVGFLSLTVADAVIIQRFGLVCAGGVVLAFVSIIILVPLLSSTWFARNVHRGYGRDLVHRNLAAFERFIDFVIAHAHGLSFLGVAITALLATSVFWLAPDNRLSEDFPSTSGAAITLGDVDRHFGGILHVTATVDWPDGATLDSPETIAALRAAQDVLDREPDIRNSLSVLDLLVLAPGDGDLASKVPLLEFVPPEVVNRLVREDLGRALVNARVQDLGFAHYEPIYESVARELRGLESVHPGYRFQLTGLPLVRGRVFQNMILDLASSVALASVIIFVIMALALRSLRLGLISIIPNLFPLVVTSTALVVCGLPLQLASVCAFTICLGIAVDDTIHFMSRFQQELAETRDVPSAVRRAFVSVGAALVTTTIVLTAGFCTVFFSEMPITRLFGALACGTILSALLGDMLFLPALLVRFIPNPDPVPEEASSPQHEAVSSSVS